jgi:hypothetical protein
VEALVAVEAARTAGDALSDDDALGDARRRDGVLDGTGGGVGGQAAAVARAVRQARVARAAMVDVPAPADQRHRRSPELAVRLARAGAQVPAEQWGLAGYNQLLRQRCRYHFY